MSYGNSPEEAALAAEEMGWNPFKGMRNPIKQVANIFRRRRRPVPKTKVEVQVRPTNNPKKLPWTAVVVNKEIVQGKGIIVHRAYGNTPDEAKLKALGWAKGRGLSVASIKSDNMGAAAPARSVAVRRRPDGGMDVKFTVPPSELDALREVVQRIRSLGPASAPVVLGSSGGTVTVRGVRLTPGPGGSVTVEASVSADEARVLKNLIAALGKSASEPIVLGCVGVEI